VLLLLLLSSYSNIPVTKIRRHVHYYIYQWVGEIFCPYIQCSLVQIFGAIAASRSTSWVYSRLLAGTVGSNTAGVIRFFLLYVVVC
jgi:hypothetical protein